MIDTVVNRIADGGLEQGAVLGTLAHLGDKDTVTLAEPSKRQVLRTQAIGKRLVCENVPQIKPNGRR